MARQFQAMVAWLLGSPIGTKQLSRHPFKDGEKTSHLTLLGGSALRLMVPKLSRAVTWVGSGLLLIRWFKDALRWRGFR
jgi:hypothetical protein